MSIDTDAPVRAATLVPGRGDVRGDDAVPEHRRRADERLHRVHQRQAVQSGLGQSLGSGLPRDRRQQQGGMTVHGSDDRDDVAPARGRR